MQRKTPKQPWRLAFVPVLILLTKDTEAFSIGRTYTSCTRLLVLLDANNREASLDPTLQSKVRRRKRQARRKPVQRRPKYYWSDPSNLRSELCEFWKNCGVETVGPTIPNEVLLMHYERHDLRAAIAKNGGRNSVSELLGGAPIMPGRWNKAVAHSRELQQLLRVDASLTADRPPRCCIHVSSTTVEPNAANDKNWSHHGGRNPKGYWSLQTVIQEL